MTSQLSNEDIQEKLVSLTRDLILIPSIPSKPEEQRRCYESIKNHIDSLDNIEIKEYEKDGSLSFVAGPKGFKKPDVLMCAHLDVITHHDIDVYTSKIEDGKIIGPGAGDMKGALAILLEVFRSVHTQKSSVSLALAITSDEEVGGEAGIGFLFGEKELRCKTAMIPDGGSLTHVTVEEKGILHLRVICLGETSHAARPWLGENPINHLVEGLVKVRQYFEDFKINDDHWVPSCAVTIIETENETVNRIPTDAIATLDIRFPPPFTVKKLLEDIQEIMGRDVVIKKIISAEPTHLSPDELYQNITTEVTGQSVELVRDHGGSDARFIAAHGIPVMMSRPLVGKLHATDEWIDIDSMVKLYQIYERYLKEKLKI